LPEPEGLIGVHWLQFYYQTLAFKAPGTLGTSLQQQKIPKNTTALSQHPLPATGKSLITMDSVKLSESQILPQRYVGEIE
jgi:hypothetical protein